MTNIDDARDFMILRGDEETAWYTFLKTKGSQDPDDQDMHEAARQAVSYFDQKAARQKSTPELARTLIDLYRSQKWELDNDSLASIQVDAITEQLELRHDTGEFFAAYAREHAHDDTAVAFSNEVFVTAWTDEVLRLDKGDAA